MRRFVAAAIAVLPILVSAARAETTSFTLMTYGIPTCSGVLKVCRQLQNFPVLVKFNAPGPCANQTVDLGTATLTHFADGHYKVPNFVDNGGTVSLSGSLTTDSSCNVTGFSVAVSGNNNNPANQQNFFDSFSPTQVFEDHTTPFTDTFGSGSFTGPPYPWAWTVVRHAR